MPVSVANYINAEIEEHGSVRVGQVLKIMGCSRQYVYRLVERSKNLVVSNGVIIRVHQGKFIQSMIGWGLRIDPELLSKAIEFAEQENFDLSSVYDRPFSVDSEGVGLLRVIQALIIACSRDLPFKMTLELD